MATPSIFQSKAIFNTPNANKVFFSIPILKQTKDNDRPLSRSYAAFSFCVRHNFIGMSTRSPLQHSRQTKLSDCQDARWACHKMLKSVLVHERLN